MQTVCLEHELLVGSSRFNAITMKIVLMVVMMVVVVMMMMVITVIMMQ